MELVGTDPGMGTGDAMLQVGALMTSDASMRIRGLLESNSTTGAVRFSLSDWE